MVVTWVLIGLLITCALILLTTIFLRFKTGVPTGDIISSDSKEFPGELLISKSIPLRGKPDYIIKNKKLYIPVEVKTGKTPSMPYKNHIAQLYSYCYLVAEKYSVLPQFGVLAYPDKRFDLEYTKEDGQHISLLVDEMMEKKNQPLSREGIINVCKMCRGKGHVGVWGIEESHNL